MTDARAQERRSSSAAVTLLRHGYATLHKEEPLLSTGLTSLETVAKRIRSGPHTQQLTEAFRRTQAQLGGKHPTVKHMKSRLPAIIPSLALLPGRPVRNLPEALPHTGLYVYDIDQDVEPDQLPDILTSLADYQHTLLAARSTSGNALYVIMAAVPAEDPLQHKVLSNAVRAALPEHIRRHAAPSQDNINRTRILAHDPECVLAPSAVPMDPPVPDLPAQAPSHLAASRRPAPAGTPRRTHHVIQSISEAHRQTELVRAALAALPSYHADTYATWIRTAFRLAGGQHIHGPAFRGKLLFTEWSRTSPKYRPGDEDVFDSAFAEWDGRATTAGILAEARQAGWRPPSSPTR